jgi:hypothetical protein
MYVLYQYVFRRGSRLGFDFGHRRTDLLYPRGESGRNGKQGLSAPLEEQTRRRLVYYVSLALRLILAGSSSEGRNVVSGEMPGYIAVHISGLVKVDKGRDESLACLIGKAEKKGAEIWKRYT